MSCFYEEKEKKRTESYYLKSYEELKERDVEILVSKIKEIFTQSLQKEQEIVFLCIGSDRYIGDSLGPLVGTMLLENQVPYRIYGTLKEPIHAFNLEVTVKNIHKQIKNPFIISVDACIGEKSQVGYVLFKEGSLAPGAALKKVLPKVGDYHFVGIINYLDSLPTSQFLNDTRLYTVMNIAKTIVKVITKINT